MNTKNKIQIAEFTTPQNVYFVMDYFPANLPVLEYLKGIAFTDDSATVKVYDNNDDEPVKWLDSCNSLLYILNEEEFNIYIEHYKNNEGFEDEELEEYYYSVKDFTGIIYLAIENEDEVIADSIEEKNNGHSFAGNPTKLTKEAIDKATFNTQDCGINKDICEFCNILPCSFELIIESN